MRFTRVWGGVDSPDKPGNDGGFEDGDAGKKVKSYRLRWEEDEFNIRHSSSVSPAVERIRRKKGSRKFRKMYVEI